MENSLKGKRSDNYVVPLEEMEVRKKILSKMRVVYGDNFKMAGLRLMTTNTRGFGIPRDTR